MSDSLQPVTGRKGTGYRSRGADSLAKAVNPGMTTRRKQVRWAALTGLLIVALGVVLWIRRFHHYTPIEAAQDLRAAAASRTAPRPVERFLELRYGTLTDPANRQKAFLDFFNVGHIEGLYLVVDRIPAERRNLAIGGMANWIESYRNTMTPEEKESLNAYLRSEAGRATLQRATARYLQHDVRYRSDTAPVIAELMATLAAVQKP
jgi:hypothetical protein